MPQFRFNLALGVAAIAATVIGLHDVGPAQAQQAAAAPRQLAEANCASCHGVDGNTTADPLYPKLAGQKASYLREQLNAFKTGSRKSDVMSAAVAPFSDAQLRDLAYYYSGQPAKADPLKDAKLAATGARIFRYASRAAMSCAACHGNAGAASGGMMGGGRMGGGMMGGGMMRGGMMMGNIGIVPNLNAQHAAYIVQQLDAFASGTRRGTVMGPIARTWREKDRQAVAAYLASLH